LVDGQDGSSSAGDALAFHRERASACPPLLRDGPAGATLSFVLAHSAGSPMDTPFMIEAAGVLAAAGIQVVRFEFPYMRARRSGGRRAPDRMPALQDCYRTVVAELGDPARIVIGGRSMGGRVASMLADELGVAGLLCFGYPFHPPDKPSQLRTAHLAELRTRTLIIQGTRDPFGTPDEIAGYALSPAIRLRYIEDGDHSLKPRKKSGRSEKEARDEALAAAVEFLRGLSR
jgi:predicted alpha/beta-hydrolase family hydrolase